MHRVRRLAVGAALVGLFLAAGPASSWSGSPAAGLPAGTAAPAFAAKDLAGRPIDFAALVKKSKATVVNFWGLRCQACLEEMPSLNALYLKYKDAGVAFLGINVDGVGADIINAQLPRVVQTAPDYPLVPDEELKVADLFKMTAAPMTVVINASGIVTFSHEGYEAGDEKELEDRIAALAR